MITKIKALDACVKIWSGLAKTGAARKQRWAIKKYPKHGCPCCSYADDYKLLCQECILIGLWPNMCRSDDSPYKQWEMSANSKLRKKYANIIADYANKLLAKESKSAQKIIDRLDKKREVLKARNDARRK